MLLHMQLRPLLGHLHMVLPIGGDACQCQCTGNRDGSSDPSAVKAKSTHKPPPDGIGILGMERFVRESRQTNFDRSRLAQFMCQPRSLQNAALFNMRLLKKPTMFPVVGMWTQTGGTVSNPAFGVPLDRWGLPSDSHFCEDRQRPNFCHGRITP